MACGVGGGPVSRRRTLEPRRPTPHLGSVSKRLLIAALAGALLGDPTGARAAELIVRVVGMEAIAGNVHYGIYDRPETFPNDKGQRFEGWVEVKGPEAVIRIPNIPKGRYGVAVFHDENANGVIDKGLFGVPVEDYGFSNDAPAFLGPPSFEDAAVTIPDEATDTVVDITVTLR